MKENLNLLFEYATNTAFDNFINGINKVIDDTLESNEWYIDIKDLSKLTSQFKDDIIEDYEIKLAEPLEVYYGEFMYTLYGKDSIITDTFSVHY